MSLLGVSFPFSGVLFEGRSRPVQVTAAAGVTYVPASLCLGQLPAGYAGLAPDGAEWPPLWARVVALCLLGGGWGGLLGGDTETLAGCGWGQEGCD